MSKNPKRVVLIAGPTASGKSAYAVKLALTQNGVVMNADSMQVYRELRLVTARPSVAEEAMVPHRLYGHVSAQSNYSVAEWQAQALAEVKVIHEEGQVPIITGGTGLYFMSLLNGLSEVPEIKPEIREKWRKFAGDLHGELHAVDEVLAAKLHPADRQRLIRALEVFESTGQSLLHWQTFAKANAPLQNYEVEKHFVNVPRDILYARAEKRFDMMLEQGAMEEVRHLPPLDPAAPLMKAIGVPELLAHLRGEISLDEAIIYAKRATRHYIKRQLTWWRGQMTDWEETSPQALHNLL